MSSSLTLAKDALRRSAKARRAEAALGAPGAGEMLARHFLESALGESARTAQTVAAYWPIGSEIDPRPLMQALHAQGCTIALPVISPEPGPLSFLEWAPGCAMQAHGFGTQIPCGARPVVPRFLLVPLLAFDRRGGRLGYGQGHYDRTLDVLRADGHKVTAVGLAFAAQEVDHVPTEPHDTAMDWVVTEKGVIECRRA